MSGKKECCGTCIYHKHDDDVDYICICEDSDGYGEYTMFQDYCDYWARRIHVADLFDGGGLKC